MTQYFEEHNMKAAGYWPCRNEIIAAHLSTPHKYEPFTELFDVDQLDAVRDKYGVDLYRECYADALHEVMEAATLATVRIDGQPINAYFWGELAPQFAEIVDSLDDDAE